MSVRILNPTEGPVLLEPEGPGAVEACGWRSRAGRLRGSDLAALQSGEAALVAGGRRLRFGRGKTEQAGQGAEIKLPRGRAARDLSGAGRMHLRWLRTARERGMLDRLLPEPAAATMPSQTLLRRCSAWPSAFTAILALANQSDAGLAHEGALGMVHVHAGTAANWRLADIQRTLDNSVDG